MRRGEGKYFLIDALSAILGAAAVFLFVKDHVLLGLVAGTASFLLISVTHRALDDGRIDEALEAKAEYDRLHGDDPAPQPPRHSADD
ncbi:hypothetical protein ACT4S2_09205 [Kocuria turfanensis]|uniref:hypothetical protein n=1 Tax=Kocuria turfanensis TaxID=388357 RepID=UPI0040354785